MILDLWLHEMNFWSLVVWVWHFIFIFIFKIFITIYRVLLIFLFIWLQTWYLYLYLFYLPFFNSYSHYYYYYHHHFCIASINKWHASRLQGKVAAFRWKRMDYSLQEKTHNNMHSESLHITTFFHGNCELKFSFLLF